ncbi:MAG: phosphoglyceromutase [Saprospiraceae bacterium]|nr:phosphoglyceromutase [Saprospiraceae bacterium]
MKQLLLLAGLVVGLAACQTTTTENAAYANPKGYQTENIFILTYDGLRWQEMFNGADSNYFRYRDFVADSTEMVTRFWDSDTLVSREKLLPFFWQVVAKQGQLYGNRRFGNHVDNANPYWFSYPGYNEILTGYPDTAVNSNDKVYNQNITVLEFLNRQPDLQGKVAAFGSWDVFPYIINDQRSGIPVNAGYAKATGDGLSDRETLLNELQETVPGHWGSVRMDAFTHHFAMEYIKKNKPRVVFISYGETDDFAHDGDYDRYLCSAYYTDAMIRQLWEYCQSTPQYKGKTTFLLTTDHGRGDNKLEDWKHHGKSIEGSYEMWLGILGPDTQALGEVKTPGNYYQKQVAKTVAELMGFDFAENPAMGEILKEMLAKK